LNTHPHQPHLLHLPSPFRPPHNPSPGQPEQAARHVLATGPFHHLVGELKANVGDLRH
ncbi:hypothetical protein N339_00892, partial [Pterocles gutturalis]